MPSIQGDPGQITQVILNLVRNAVEASQKNGVVKIYLDANENEVILRIIDNGPGFSSHSLEKLFKPFYTTKERGTGLDLPVVYAIIQNHGGRIRVNNGDSGGAIVEVTFPAVYKQIGKIKLDVLVIAGEEESSFSLERVLRISGLKVASCIKQYPLSKLKKTTHPNLVC